MRESPANPGQYVLTGLQNNLKKHLLLVDPEGIVSPLSYTMAIRVVEFSCGGYKIRKIFA